MEPEEKCRLLARELKKTICGKLILNSDVIHFIDSTFANPTTAELQTILSDESNCEKDSLMELLFFPDESIQAQLEDILEELQLHKQHEKMVIDCLMQEPLKVSVHFPDERQPLELIIPDSIITQLLSRLHISKHLNARLIEAINQKSNEFANKRFKVKIRNSRFTPTEDSVGFLCAFFKKMDSPDDEILECLDFIVDFLDDLTKDDDIYQALIAKKRSYFFSLQKAKQLTIHLQKDNIETLLLQGRRVVVIDQADIHQKMLIIDRISKAVFGKTEYFEPLLSNEEAFDFHRDQDIKKIIGTLS